MNLSPTTQKHRTGSGNPFQIPTEASEWVVWCSARPKVSTLSWEVATEFALALLSQLVTEATFKYSQTRRTELKEGVSTTAAHAPHSLWSEGRTSRQAYQNLLLTSAFVCVENDLLETTKWDWCQWISALVISTRFEESVEAMASVTTTKLWASLGDDAKALFDAEV